MDNMKAIDIVEGVYDDAEDHEVIAAWQHLIDTGLVWQLQGFFGRQAARLIDDGVCTP
jgi:fatty acid-binding protein DegV|tara:strand:+ start:541 stop:714 length:174 start_codon:yes stop_codon:yes gene_type:complete